jgi:hypothetical protein
MTQNGSGLAYLIKISHGDPFLSEIQTEKECHGSQLDQQNLLQNRRKVNIMIKKRHRKVPLKLA